MHEVNIKEYLGRESSLDPLLARSMLFRASFHVCLQFELLGWPLVFWDSALYPSLWRVLCADAILLQTLSKRLTAHEGLYSLVVGP